MQIDNNKRPRSALKTYFAKNAIPTDGQFSQLIDSQLNQRDDGIVKAAGDPLSIEAAGDDVSLKRAVNFYNSFADADPAWTISLKPRSKPADAGTARAGWSVGDAAGNSRLFIDSSNGNAGIGTVTPAEKLEVTGRVRASMANIGPWPANANLSYFGSSALDQSNAANYALLQANDPGGATYLNSPSQVSLRIGNSDRMVIQKDAVTVAPAVRFANSDIYFTETNHFHTGFGNTTGYAAIENAVNYGALMLLGRNVNPPGAPLNRVVKVWDYLEVNGRFQANGDLTYTGQQNKLDVGPTFTAVVRCADFTMGGQPGRRGSPGRALVDNTDALVLNYGPDWPKTTIDGLCTILRPAAGCSAALKKDIEPMSSETAAAIVDRLDPVTFRWIKDDQDRRLGFIAEDCPDSVTTPDRDGIFIVDVVAALTKVVRDQSKTIAGLQAKLEAFVAGQEAGKGAHS